jgi:hypothetical protein
MKTHLPKHSSILLAALTLAISGSVSRADIPVFDVTFDNAGSFATSTGFPNYSTYGLDNSSTPIPNVRFDFGGTTTTAGNVGIAFSTNDAAGNPASGSIKFTIPMDVTVDGNNTKGAFTFDFYHNTTAASNLTSLSFDVMVDPSSSPEQTNNVAAGYGFLQFVSRDANYSFNSITNFGEDVGAAYTGVTAGHWQHVVIPLNDTVPDDVIRGLTFQLYGGAGQNIMGTVIMYLDNITVSTAGAIPQPTNSISQLTGPKGLYLRATDHPTVDTSQYERQGIATAASAYSWVGSGTNQVTYSLTITNFPSLANSNFEAYIFLAPTNSFSGGPTEPNPDWVEGDIITFSIQNNADGTATGNLSYKTDDGNDNAFLTSVGTVSSTSPLGTWSITFTNDDDVTITSSSGTVSNTTLGGNGPVFGNLVTAYIGIQPNSTNNTGQQAVFSKFQIVSNGIPLLSDNFSTATLNSSTWIVAAEDPAGLLQIPQNAALMLNWTLPATGFSLQSSSNLSDTNSWHNPGFQSSTFNGQGTVIIPSTFLATNNASFFRLVHP